jgi:hypothetical protein
VSTTTSTMLFKLYDFYLFSIFFVIEIIESYQQSYEIGLEPVKLEYLLDDDEIKSPIGS